MWFGGCCSSHGCYDCCYGGDNAIVVVVVVVTVVVGTVEYILVLFSHVSALLVYLPFFFYLLFGAGRRVQPGDA